MLIYYKFYIILFGVLLFDVYSKSIFSFYYYFIIFLYYFIFDTFYSSTSSYIFFIHILVSFNKSLTSFISSYVTICFFSFLEHILRQIIFPKEFLFLFSLSFLIYSSSSSFYFSASSACFLFDFDTLIVFIDVKTGYACFFFYLYF